MTNNDPCSSAPECSAELVAQQRQLASSDARRLAAEHSALESQHLGISLNFQRLARAHGLPVSPNCRPYRNEDQTDRARWFKIGARASSALGVVVFALLSVLSLSVPAPLPIVFVASAAVGLLLALVVAAGVCLVTGVSAANPSSERKIFRLAKASGLLALGSATAFMLLRFIGDTYAQSYVSIVLVTFEASVFLLGGAMEAARLLYEWSARLAERHDAIEKEILDVQQRLRAVNEELRTLGVEDSQKVEVSKERGPDHEVRQQIDAVVPVDVARAGVGKRAPVNGMDRS